MRLDKFLKVSRLIKRRTLAKEVSESERVLVNGKIAKPSITPSVILPRAKPANFDKALFVLLTGEFVLLAYQH